MAERTKIWIADRMKELMKHKTLNKIRITEICQAAQIERSTFYYHFSDKYDLVAWIFYHDNFGTDVLDPAEAAASMKRMKKEVLFYRRAYEDDSQNALMKYINQYFLREYTEAARRLSGEKELSDQLLFSIRLYCYGATEAAREWIVSESDIPAETMVEMMFNSMPGCMHELYFR